MTVAFCGGTTQWSGGANPVSVSTGSGLLFGGGSGGRGSSGGGGGIPTYTVTGTGVADRSPQPVSTPPGLQLPAPAKDATCGAIPTHPQSASVDSNIRQAQIVSAVSLLGGPLTQSAVSLGWFAEKELPNKAWDYKTQGQRYDAFGNFNYGAVGAALGLPSYLLQTAGGALSTILRTNNQKYGKWYHPPLYGHAPAKSTAISAGIEYYQNGCSL